MTKRARWRLSLAWPTPGHTRGCDDEAGPHHCEAPKPCRRLRCATREFQDKPDSERAKEAAAKPEKTEQHQGGGSDLGSSGRDDACIDRPRVTVATGAVNEEQREHHHVGCRRELTEDEADRERADRNEPVRRCWVAGVQALYRLGRLNQSHVGLLQLLRVRCQSPHRRQRLPVQCVLLRFLGQKQKEAGGESARDTDGAHL